MTIDDYFRSDVEPCRDCERDPAIAPYITYHKLAPFVGGANPKVLLLGHSPRVRSSSRIAVTLDLDARRNLTRYIRNEVLHPLGIPLEACAATNAVKCLTTEMPEDITVADGFVQRAFNHCQRHLVNEVSSAGIILLISLSERVSSMLQVVFAAADSPQGMREIFATLRMIKIGGNALQWIPVVHLPKAKVRNHYFPEQTRRLEAIAGQVTELLA